MDKNFTTKNTNESENINYDFKSEFEPEIETLLEISLFAKLYPTTEQISNNLN